MNFEGLRDKHLNVFWQFDGKPWLENNITKAFVNVIDSLSVEDKKPVFQELFGVVLPDAPLKFDYYLQKKPNPEKILEFAEDKRMLFAFSPTGRCWSFADAISEEDGRKVIEADFRKKYPEDEEYKENLNKALDEFQKGRGGDSIPDGWILIYSDGKPFEVIAIENKLYDLDRYQLNNHLEKSLFLPKGTNPIRFSTYESIVQSFEKSENVLAGQFVEYLILLGYIQVRDFKTACSIDNDLAPLMVCDAFGLEIIKAIHSGDVDKRNRDTCRCHVNYPYLKELNLSFRKEGIQLHLSFGSRQNDGKMMLGMISPDSLPQHDHLKIFSTFHLKYHRGRALGTSYFPWQGSISSFVAYWKKNMDSIRLMTPDEARHLYIKIEQDGYMVHDDFLKLRSQILGKSNPVEVIPEITMQYSWAYEEAAAMGLDGFIAELKKSLAEALATMRL
jgi:hypothetical protein